VPHCQIYCLDCKNLCSKMLAMVDRNTGEVVCPRCGSRRIELRWDAFYGIGKEQLPFTTRPDIGKQP